MRSEAFARGDAYRGLASWIEQYGAVSNNLCSDDGLIEG